MVALLSKLILVFSLILLPPTGLILISQNALPGESTYGIKRALENVIVSAFSLHPATKAYFRADFSNRRYKEVIAVVKKGNNNIETLVELVVQTKVAAKEIEKISDPKTKQVAQQKLEEQIVEYKKGLEEIQTTWEKNETQAPIAVIVPTPTSTPTPTIISSETTAILPTTVPTSTPIPTSTQIPPTPTPIPTVAQPVVAQPETPQTPAQSVDGCLVSDPRAALRCLDKITISAVDTTTKEAVNTPSPTRAITPVQSLATPTPYRTPTKSKAKSNRGFGIASLEDDAQYPQCPGRCGGSNGEGLSGGYDWAWTPGTNNSYDNYCKYTDQVQWHCYIGTPKQVIQPTSTPIPIPTSIPTTCAASGGSCADSQGKAPGLSCTDWIQGQFKDCTDTAVYAYCYSSCTPNYTTP